MNGSKQKKLEAAGWKVGSAAEFLDLTAADEMLVNMKLSLAKKAKELRQRKKLTQEDVAKLIGSSQSRVAKMEIADRSVSLELLVRALARLGASRAQICDFMGKRATRKTTTKQGKPATKKRLVKG